MSGKLVRDTFHTRRSGHNFESAYETGELYLEFLPVLFTFDWTVCTGCEVENCKVW